MRFPRRRRLHLSILLLPAVLLVGTAGARAAVPARIVSTNLCTDQLAVALIETERLASVSFLAADPTLSNVVDAVRDLPANHALVEEIARFDPDLVLAGAHRERRLNDRLRRLGYRVHALAAPNSLAELRRAVTDLAAVLGVPERGADLIAGMDRALAALAADAGADRPTALVFRPNGYTSGAGTLVDEVMALAGFDNLAARSGVAGGGNLSLESLVVAAPDLIVFDNPGERGWSLAQRLQTHPVLARLRPRTRFVALPGRLWVCAGPWIVEAAARLRAVRER